MKKLTKAMLDVFKASPSNVVFKKDGFVKIMTKNADVVCDWVNENTLKFASDNYDELEKEVEAFYSKNTEGLSIAERLDKIDRETSFADKVKIAHLNNRTYYGY